MQCSDQETEGATGGRAAEEWETAKGGMNYNEGDMLLIYLSVVFRLFFPPSLSVLGPQNQHNIICMYIHDPLSSCDL